MTMMVMLMANGRRPGGTDHSTTALDGACAEHNKSLTQISQMWVTALVGRLGQAVSFL